MTYIIIFSAIFLLLFPLICFAIMVDKFNDFDQTSHSDLNQFVLNESSASSRCSSAPSHDASGIKNHYWCL